MGEKVVRPFGAGGGVAQESRVTTAVGWEDSHILLLLCFE